MLIYLFLLIIIVFLILIMNNCGKIEKKIIFTLITVMITLIIGLRNIELGLNDTQKLYVPEFYRIINLSFLTIFQDYKDPAFYILTKFYTLFSHNISLWLILCCLPYVSGIFYLIKKYSKFPMLSVIMFLSLNYFGIAFTAIRHCIALGIICYSFKYIEEKKPIKFILIILFASLFHLSALAFVFSYLIVNRKKDLDTNKYFKLIITIIIVFLISLLFGKSIIKFILNVIINTFHLVRFSIYNENTLKTLNFNIFFINFFLYILCGFIYNSIKWNDANKKEKHISSLFLDLLFIATIVSSFNNILGECYRISMFFSVFSIILLPNLLTLINDKDTKKIMSITIIIILIMYFFGSSLPNSGILPYKFY